MPDLGVGRQARVRTHGPDQRFFVDVIRPAFDLVHDPAGKRMEDDAGLIYEDFLVSLQERAFELAVHFLWIRRLICF